MPRKLIEIDCTLEHETEKAVKVTTDVKADVWVPKTLCGFEKDDPDAETPCKGTITLNEFDRNRQGTRLSDAQDGAPALWEGDFHVRPQASSTSNCQICSCR